MQELTNQDLSIVSGGGWWSDLGDAIDRAVDKVRDSFGSVSANASASASIEHCTTVTTNKTTFKQCETYGTKADASGSASVGKGGKKDKK